MARPSLSLGPVLRWLAAGSILLLPSCGTQPQTPPDAPPTDPPLAQALSGPLDKGIATGNDDAEEYENGKLKLNSGTLQLVYDGATHGNQTVGLRFVGIPVPQGTVVTSAYIQFTARKKTSGPAELTIAGVASGNVAPFSTALRSLSSLPRTGATVPWSPPAWGATFESGTGQRTPDLAQIVNETLARPDWAPGNAMAFVLTGTGARVASGFEDGASRTPVLHLEFQGCAAPPCNEPPSVNAGPDVTTTFPTAVPLLASIVDDGPNTVAWQQLSGPGTLTFTPPDAASTTVTASELGGYTVRVTVDDGEFTRSDDLAILWSGDDAGTPNPIVSIQQVRGTATGFDGGGTPLPVPSIDPAGVAYYAPTSSLLITDSEIDEDNVAAAWAIVQANAFQASLSGDALLNKWDLTTPSLGSNIEPTGVVYCAFDTALYISTDQSPRGIYRYLLADGALELTDVLPIKDYAKDAEDVTCDPATGRLYAISGSEQHVIVFDYSRSSGLSHVSTVDLFQTAGDRLGVPSDGEGITFDPKTRHLFIVSRSDKAIFEYTVDGLWIRTFSIAAFSNPPIKKPAGLTIGAASADPSKESFYIVDRRWDNDSDPNERDGALYEALIQRAH